jgi:uncharacterized protein (DUF58 family)
MQGERRSTARGQSVEFSDFRPYSSGDDFRRIDWNAYARLERLFIKLFVEEQDVTLHLLVDNSPSMDWGTPNKLALARRAAGAIGYVALLGMDRVSASALYPHNGSTSAVSSLRGKRSALSLFTAIQSIDPHKSAVPLVNRIGQILGNSSRPGAFVILSDLFDDGWQPAANLLLGRGHQLSLIHILSPDEIDPDFNGDFRLVDSETNSHVEITADFETLQDYSSQRQSWQAGWRRFCSARQAAYLPISSDLPLEELLFSQLPKLGVLR